MAANKRQRNKKNNKVITILLSPFIILNGLLQWFLNTRLMKWFLNTRIMRWFAYKDPHYSDEMYMRKKRVNHRIPKLRRWYMITMVVLVLNMTRYSFFLAEQYETTVLSRLTGRERNIEPLRGNVVDRNNKTIATSVLAYDLILDPKAILGNDVSEAQRAHLYDTLGEYKGVPPSQVQKEVEDNPTSMYRRFMTKIPAADKLMLESQNLKGIWFEETFTRSYPKEELAAQVLGYYNGTSGQYGIEQTYNEWLKGEEGRIFTSLQQGNIVTSQLKPAVNGSTVVLTLDEVIQQYVEQTMNYYIEQTNPLNAAALVMNPKTGEVYAMFSYPYTSPTSYNSLSDQVGEGRWETMEQEERSEMVNRAWSNYNIQNPYELGSTFKPIMVAAALEEGYISADFQHECVGWINVSGQRINCWHTAGHGVQNVTQILANSCNPGTIAIAEQVPTEVFYDYMKRFGFGERTEIDLIGESTGSLHSETAFGPVEKAVASMGQGFTATSMQLMTAFSALINGGYLVEPYLVSEIIDAEGRVVYDGSTQLKRQVISEETSRQVTLMLEAVLTEGTGGAAAVTGYRIGGKTGTAQKGYPRERGREILSFVGYAPSEDPEVIVITIFDELEDPDDAAGLATNAFSDMMVNILPYLKISTDESNGATTINTGVVPNVMEKDIHQAVTMLENEGFMYDTVGVGNNVVQQYPAPGEKMPKGSVVKIYLESDDLENVMTVPNLVGYTVSEAIQIVGEDFVIEGPDTTRRITSQIPKAGTQIDKNSKIIVQTLQE